MKKSIAIATLCACIAYPSTGSAAKSGVMKLFQQALVAAGQDVDESGSYDDSTRAAMQAVQVASGLATTEYPDDGTLSLLSIPASIWKSVVESSGAPEADVENAGRAAKQVIADSLATDMQDVFADSDADSGR